MRKLLPFLCVAALSLCSAYAEIERNVCRENHEPPPNVDPDKKIGEIAGYRVFGLFVDEGGYGTDESTLAQIEALSENYWENEFKPRQLEANDIYDWLNATHYIDDGSETVTCSVCGIIHTMPEYEALRDAKVVRLNELSSEIDAEWTALADIIRVMISDESYKEFLDAH